MWPRRSNLGICVLVGITTAFAPRTPAAEPPITEPPITIGFCTDDLERAQAAGFDYAELGVRNFTALSEEAFRAFQARHKAVGLPTPVGYLFLPPEMKVV